MKLILQAKCDDSCNVELRTDDHRKIEEIDGYPPSIQGLCGGDYINIEIDLTTGVVNGLPPAMVIETIVKEKAEEQRAKEEQYDKAHEEHCRMEETLGRNVPFKFNKYG
jgi:hypothetical protein